MNTQRSLNHKRNAVVRIRSNEDLRVKLLANLSDMASKLPPSKQIWTNLKEMLELELRESEYEWCSLVAHAVDVCDVQSYIELQLQAKHTYSRPLFSALEDLSIFFESEPAFLTRTLAWRTNVLNTMTRVMLEF